MPQQFSISLKIQEGKYIWLKYRQALNLAGRNEKIYLENEKIYKAKILKKRNKLWFSDDKNFAQINRSCRHAASVNGA